MNIWNILEYTAVISVVGLLILAMKWIFHDKLDARWHYFIWLVLLVRMIVPVDFDLVRTPLSVFQQIPVEKWLEKGRILADKQEMNALFELLGRVYLWGAVVLAVVYLVSWMTLWVKILRAPKADGETYAYVREIARKYGLKGCRRICVCDSNTPYIFGLIAPTLVLPKECVKLKEEMIVHELIHLRCKDVFINLLLHVVRVVNWFNPFVWWLCAVVQNDSEALCDQRVLERCGQERATGYGEMLICMTAGRKYRPVKIGTSNMASSFRNMKTRIVRIRDFSRVPGEIGFVTFCITLMLIVAGIGSSAEEYSSLKTPVVHSEQDLERGLLEARCYHAPTPYQAVYLFLCSVKERNLFYRMAVMPEEYASGLEDFAKICFETDLVHDEDYGSVETWDPEVYSPYFPMDMNDAEWFTVYNLQYDELSGQATVVAGTSDLANYMEWELELIWEDGWKVWLAEESVKFKAENDGEYIPDPLLYGSAMLGDFKVEVRAFNEGHFNALDKGSKWSYLSFKDPEEDKFPQFFSMEYHTKCVYLAYLGDDDLTGKQVRVETAASLEELAQVSLGAGIKGAMMRLLEEAAQKAEETGDKLILEDAQVLVSEIKAKLMSDEKLTKEEMEEIGELLGISEGENDATEALDKRKYMEALIRLNSENAEEYIDWSDYLTTSFSSSDGRSYHTYSGEELMGAKIKLLSGGGGGHSEPGYGWTLDDVVGSYVRIYINGELVQEGSVWSQNH